MKESERCIHCMLGAVSGGECTRCGKPAFDPKRSVDALPARHLLGRRYIIGRILGNGGFGITYLAWDCKYKRRIAVKELFPKFPHNAFRRFGSCISVTQSEQQYFGCVKKRFCEEAQLLYELRNVPEIINVYHLFEENGTAYYAMEYLEGEDLQKRFERSGKMTWQEMVNPLCMILRALYAVHGKGLIHRDISPDNILVTNNGKVKLIDFGATRHYIGNRDLTAILKGNFAPYEQFRSEPQGPWTDIYALCATMYRLLSGKLPIKATDRKVALYSGEPDPMMPIRSLCPELPSHVATALQKGMAISAEQRYQTICELAAQLFPNTDVLGKCEPMRKSRYVKCVSGICKEKSQSLNPGVNITFGRSEECTIRYPAGSQGISRHQCSLTLDNKGIAYVRDENSSFGTFLNGNRLKPQIWYPLKSGDRIRFAAEEYCFYK